MWYNQYRQLSVSANKCHRFWCPVLPHHSFVERIKPVLITLPSSRACVCLCIFHFHAKRQSSSVLENPAPPAPRGRWNTLPLLSEGSTEHCCRTTLHRWKRECSPGLTTSCIIRSWQPVAVCCPDKCQLSINQKNSLPTWIVISPAQDSAVKR